MLMFSWYDNILEYSGAPEALVRRIEQHHSGIREAPLKQLNYYSWYPGMLVKALPSQTVLAALISIPGYHIIKLLLPL